MTRVCSGCGLFRCEGECYLDERERPEEEKANPPKLTKEQRQAFQDWCAEQDLRRKVERELKRTIEIQRKDAA